MTSTHLPLDLLSDIVAFVTRATDTKIKSIETLPSRPFTALYDDNDNEVATIEGDILTGTLTIADKVTPLSAFRR